MVVTIAVTWLSDKAKQSAVLQMSSHSDTFVASGILWTTYARMVTLALPRKVSECDDICNTADCLALSDNQVTTMVTTMVSAVFKAEGDDVNI